jgi:NitT/TauT family transport system substrate-binding protein
MHALRKSVASAALLLSALTASSSAYAAEPTTVTVLGAGSSNGANQGYVFLGNATGFNDKLGIKVDYVPSGGSQVVLQLIATNKGLLGAVAPLDLIQAMQKQPTLPIKAVYMHDIKTGYDLAVLEDSPIKTIGDMKGKTVGVLSMGSGTVGHTKAMLRNGGVDPNSASLLPIGVGGQAAAAIRAKQVDIICMPRSQLAVLENFGFKFRVFPAEPASAAFVVNEAALKTNRPEIIKALQSIAYSSAYAQTNPEAAVYGYWKLYGAPTGDVALALKNEQHAVERNSQLWKQIGDGRQWGQMSEADWRANIEFLGEDSGVDPKTVVYSKFFTTELLDEVNKVDTDAAVAEAKAWKKP